MELHPICYRPGNSLYPARVQTIYNKNEYGRVRTYVQTLKWDIKRQEMGQIKFFLQDVQLGFVLTDDIDAFLREKLPIYRRR